MNDQRSILTKEFSGHLYNSTCLNCDQGENETCCSVRVWHLWVRAALRRTETDSPPSARMKKNDKMTSKTSLKSTNVVLWKVYRGVIRLTVWLIDWCWADEWWDDEQNWCGRATRTQHVKKSRSQVSIAHRIHPSIQSLLLDIVGFPLPCESSKDSALD